MLSNIAIVLVTLISPAHADEQNTALQTDTSPIENPPLPRPKPSLLDATGDDPAVLISAFRHQHGEDPVVINAALTRIAQEQANAMAMRDLLDHNALAPFSSRIGRSGLSLAGENIARGYADFASTLKQGVWQLGDIRRNPPHRVARAAKNDLSLHSRGPMAAQKQDKSRVCLFSTSLGGMSVCTFTEVG